MSTENNYKLTKNPDSIPYHVCRIEGHQFIDIPNGTDYPKKTCLRCSIEYEKTPSDPEDDTEAIEKAERRVGADGTDEYFREITTPERERDPADDEDF
jgi:hypothetical protein